MKEVALTGMTCQVFADVLSALLRRDIAVNALVTDPEKVMLDDTRLTVSLLDTGNKNALRESFEGYHDVIMTFSDDQTDAAANNFALHSYNEMVSAARQAGVGRLIVVGSPEATAYFMGDLRRQDDLDWVFISTEGDFADRAAEEVMHPHFHKEEYVA